MRPRTLIVVDEVEKDQKDFTYQKPECKGGQHCWSAELVQSWPSLTVGLLSRLTEEPFPASARISIKFIPEVRHEVSDSRFVSFPDPVRLRELVSRGSG